MATYCKGRDCPKPSALVLSNPNLDEFTDELTSPSHMLPSSFLPSPHRPTLSEKIANLNMTRTKASPRKPIISGPMNVSHGDAEQRLKNSPNVTATTTSKKTRDLVPRAQSVMQLFRGNLDSEVKPRSQTLEDNYLQQAAMSKQDIAKAAKKAKDKAKQRKKAEATQMFLNNLGNAGIVGNKPADLMISPSKSSCFSKIPKPTSLKAGSSRSSLLESQLEQAKIEQSPKLQRYFGMPSSQTLKDDINSAALASFNGSPKLNRYTSPRGRQEADLLGDDTDFDSPSTCYKPMSRCNVFGWKTAGEGNKLGNSTGETFLGASQRNVTPRLDEQCSFNADFEFPQSMTPTSEYSSYIPEHSYHKSETGQPPFDRNVSGLEQHPNVMAFVERPDRVATDSYSPSTLPNHNPKRDGLVLLRSPVKPLGGHRYVFDDGIQAGGDGKFDSFRSEDTDDSPENSTGSKRRSWEAYLGSPENHKKSRLELEHRGHGEVFDETMLSTLNGFEDENTISSYVLEYSQYNFTKRFSSEDENKASDSLVDNKANINMLDFAYAEVSEAKIQPLASNTLSNRVRHRPPPLSRVSFATFGNDTNTTVANFSRVSLMRTPHHTATAASNRSLPKADFRVSRVLPSPDFENVEDLSSVRVDESEEDHDDLEGSEDLAYLAGYAS